MSWRLLAGLVAAVAALSVGAAGGVAGPTSGVTLSMFANIQYKPGYKVVIANFERVYPNIDVNITYPPNRELEAQLETTELAAGNAPDAPEVPPGLRHADLGLRARESGPPGADGEEAVGEAVAPARDLVEKARKGALRLHADRRALGHLHE